MKSCKICNSIKNINEYNQCERCFELEFQLKYYLKEGNHNAREFVINCLKEHCEYEINKNIKNINDLRSLFTDILSFHFDSAFIVEKLTENLIKYSKNDENNFYKGVLFGLHGNIPIIKQGYSILIEKMSKYMNNKDNTDNESGSQNN